MIIIIPPSKNGGVDLLRAFEGRAGLVFFYTIMTTLALFILFNVLIIYAAATKVAIFAMVGWFFLVEMAVLTIGTIVTIVVHFRG